MTIRPEVFERYAAMRVPRYTSYPTAPNFSPAIDGTEYRRWLRAVPTGLKLSLYLHIPFCREMCWYCGCHTSMARTAEDRRRAAIIERLMCGYLADIQSVDVLLDKLEEDGLVRRYGSAIEVTEEVRPLVRVVAAAFDAYLPPTATMHVTAV